MQIYINIKYKNIKKNYTNYKKCELWNVYIIQNKNSSLGKNLIVKITNVFKKFKKQKKNKSMNCGTYT